MDQVVPDALRCGEGADAVNELAHVLAQALFRNGSPRTRVDRDNAHVRTEVRDARPVTCGSREHIGGCALGG
jgi:hypothetical protein